MKVKTVVYGLLLWMLTAPQGWALTVRPLTEAELIKQSNLIVIGRCTKTKSLWVGRRLMTFATIAVTETLKGAPQTHVTVVLPGGVDASRRFPVAEIVEGAPYLVLGEDVLLFLSNINRIKGGYAVTGASQGKYVLAPASNDQASRAVISSQNRSVRLAYFRKKILGAR